MRVAAEIRRKTEEKSIIKMEVITESEMRDGKNMMDKEKGKKKDSEEKSRSLIRRRAGQRKGLQRRTGRGGRGSEGNGRGI